MEIKYILFLNLIYRLNPINDFSPQDLGIGVEVSQTACGIDSSLLPKKEVCPSSSIINSIALIY